MKNRTWVLLGATSIIAEHFAHIAAHNGCSLQLIGRNKEQLNLIANDIQLRFAVTCSIHVCDLSKNTETLFNILNFIEEEYDIFIAQSDFSDNGQLTHDSIHHLVHTNVLTTALVINHYINLNQKKHHLIYLSSVAACRGRAKNSLYGGTKAAIEVYLQGLQQAALPSQHITIAKLGFIDTKQTYGLPGIFYAAPPKECAQACWNAIRQHKRLIYFPKFWQIIMTIINHLPFFIYKRMGKI